ncbi:MAG TPA: MgtC/SapB family protein, partial [Chitinophagaceae bacterium]|nr:MgtC/SapB family protein [Chitinophagaceae bacterium]
GVEDGESTRIASYIVSGIGFIGAGVIFKDKIDVSGLTTAGIIWLAAAVGMAIGFGEFYIAAAFVVGALLIIFSSRWITYVIRPGRQGRELVFELTKAHAEQKEKILNEIRANGIELEEKRLELMEGRIIISVEATIRTEKIKWLESYLINNQYIIAFSL